MKAACSHCNEQGHRKPHCPRINVPRETLEAEWHARHDRDMQARNTIAEVLVSNVPRDRWVNALVDALNRAQGDDFSKACARWNEEQARARYELERVPSPTIVVEEQPRRRRRKAEGGGLN